MAERGVGAGNATGTSGKLELWLGPLRHVRTETIDERVYLEMLGVRRAALRRAAQACVVVFLATFWGFCLVNSGYGETIHFSGGSWVVQIGLALMILALDHARTRAWRLRGLRRDLEVSIYEGALTETPWTSLPRWVSKLYWILASRTARFSVIHDRTIIAANGRPIPRPIRCAPALVAARGADEALSDAERIEVRSIASRHSRPRFASFLMGTVAGALLFGFYTGIADRGLFTPTERYAAWLVPLACGLIGLFLGALRRRRQAAVILADRERDLVREGDAVYLAESRILWRHGDIPGPRRQERGGLVDPRVRHIARPLLGRPAGF